VRVRRVIGDSTPPLLAACFFLLLSYSFFFCLSQAPASNNYFSLPFQFNASCSVLLTVWAMSPSVFSSCPRSGLFGLFQTPQSCLTFQPSPFSSPPFFLGSLTFDSLGNGVKRPSLFPVQRNPWVFIAGFQVLYTRQSPVFHLVFFDKFSENSSSNLL